MKIKVYLKDGSVKLHAFNMHERATIVEEWVCDKYGYYNVEKWEEIN